MSNILSKGCGIPGSRKARKKSRGSSTPGKMKGLVASAKQRTYCRRSRSYKWIDYSSVMKTLGKRKTQ